MKEKAERIGVCKFVHITRENEKMNEAAIYLKRLRQMKPLPNT